MRLRDRPLLAAVRTKSWLPVSMTDALVSRMIWAKLMVASTMAGNIRSCVGAPVPTVVLNQPSWMPKMYCATKATTKIGSEMRMRLTTSALASKMPPLRRPEMRPTDDAGDHLEEDRDEPRAAA